MGSSGRLMMGDGRGGGHRYRVWAKLGVDEMMRRGRGRERDRRFGSAWWWRRRRRRRVWDWDGMGQITSGRLVSSRPESSRVGVGAGVGVHEGGGSRAASAESRIENRNRSRCLVWSCLASPCLSLPLRAGPVISPARVPMCERAGGGPAKTYCPASIRPKNQGFLSCVLLFCLTLLHDLWPFALAAVMCYLRGNTPNNGVPVPTVTTEYPRQGPLPAGLMSWAELQ